MENTGSARLSILMTAVSSVSFREAYINKTNIAWVIGVISACVAIASGIMAIRYYYYATKKLKQ